jgi:hypothetical protein
MAWRGPAGVGKAGTVTEDQLLGEVRKLAGARSVLALHLPDHLVRQLGPEWAGFPDLLLVGSCGILFVELKADGRAGLLRPAQRLFRDRLTAAGQSWVTWDPRDLRSGTVGVILDVLC